MTGSRFALAAALAALLLSACTGRPTRAPVPVDPQRAALSDAQREAIGDWSLSGRVAISGARQGGSGRIDWSQRGGHYDIRLAAPVTRQGWRLTGDARSARLEGVEGGPRESADVEQLLREATGWDVPVRAMVDWVRGVAAPGASYGQARIEYGEGDLPAVIEQAGWRIEYRDWYEAGAGQPALPRRVEATRDEARVRLLVDSWTVAAASATAVDTATPDDALARTLAGLRLDDPSADMRRHVAAGDLRPVAVCGFACLAPGYGEGGAVSHGEDMRIIDGTGDVVFGDRHLALKHRAQAYADAYNRALSAWLRMQPQAGDIGSGE